MTEGQNRTAETPNGTAETPNRTKSLYMDDEPLVSAWERASEGIYPMFATVNLNRYNSLKTDLFQSFGGRIPVMHMKDRQEFEDLICRLFYKGEKRDIPLSIGAQAIRGWKDVFGQSHRVILLSDGWYSAVLPEAVGLTDPEWKEKSLVLRRTHELAHYYTLRALGFMNNALKDELIADTMGIIEAFGEYRRDLFLRFMGLENYPEYRWGGRLQNYRPKNREMTNREFKEFQEAAYVQSGEVEALIRENPRYLESEAGKLELLKRLAEFIPDWHLR